MIRTEGLVKNKISYMKYIKLQWCHMGVIFIPKHMLRKRLKCVHILSLIIHYHTRNVYCGDVLTVHVSVFLTKNQIISIKKQHPQLGFTFITALHVVVLMVEFNWRTRKYVTCANNNLHQMNPKQYTPENN